MLLYGLGRQSGGFSMLGRWSAVNLYAVRGAAASAAAAAAAAHLYGLLSITH